MSERDSYVKQMRDAMERLQVKAGLAKLEAREVRDDLLKEYDALRERLDELGEATGDRWEALREGIDSAWRSFKRTYETAVERRREQ